MSVHEFSDDIDKRMKESRGRGILVICPVCKRAKSVTRAAFRDLDGWHLHYYCKDCDAIIAPIEDDDIPECVSGKWLEDHGFDVRW